jgi:protoheme ferro-lyase
MKTIIITLERQREIQDRKLNENKTVEKTGTVQPANKFRPLLRRPNYNAVETKNYASDVVKTITSKLNNDFDETTMKNYNVYFANQHTNDFEIVFVDKIERRDFRKIITVNDNAMINKIYQSIKNYIMPRCENISAIEQKSVA